MSKFIQSQRGVLSNGMQVDYLHLPKARSVNVMVDVPVGACHDPEGKSGLSHILEHTVFCGTQGLSEIELQARLREIGGGLNAGTSIDRTNYDIWASARDPDNFMIVADTMRLVLTEPAFPSARVEIEKKVILNEHADGLNNLERGPMDNVDRNIHRRGEPYTNVIGSAESIRATNAEDLKAFMQGNYDAGQMHVYAASPLPFDEAITVLEQTLSAIPYKGLWPKPRHNAALERSDERIVRPDLKQNYTALMFVTPKVQSLSELYGFRCAKNLVAKIAIDHLRMTDGCFYQAALKGWNSSQTKTLTAMVMSSTPEDSVLAVEGLARFAHEIDTHLTDKVIQGALNNEAYQYEDADVLTVHALGEAMWIENTVGVPYDTQAITQAYASLTPDDVRDHAKALLAGLTGMYVQGPEPDLPPSLNAIKSMMPEAPKSSVTERFNKPNATP